MLPKFAIAGLAATAVIAATALMPTAEQVTRAVAEVEALRRKHHGRIVIDAVLPDCAGDWGGRSLNVTPPALAGAVAVQIGRSTGLGTFRLTLR